MTRWPDPFQTVKLSYELIPHSMHSQKELRLIGDGLQFLAQANDVCIHGASGRVVCISPDLVEQMIAAQGFAAMAEEVFQQLELERREIHRFSSAQHLVVAEVDLD